MIHSLEIENFKAFSTRVKIPFAPITLIFGENSAGKSSILHALNLLKQTRESREAGALLLPRTNKGFVDLGSFQELLYNHDLSNRLTLKVQSSQSFIPSRLRPFPIQTTAIEITFFRPSLDEEIQLDKLKIFMANDEQAFAEFEPVDAPKDFYRTMTTAFALRDRIAARSRLRAVKCCWISDKPIFWQSAYNAICNHRSAILSMLKDRWNQLSREKDLVEQGSMLEEIDQPLDGEQLQMALERLREGISFYGEEFTLEKFISRRTKNALGAIVGLDGFMPAGRSRKGRLPEDAFFAPMFQGIFDVTDLVLYVARSFETCLDELFPLGPLRRPPDRWYIFTGTSPQDVGYDGDLLPDLLFRNPSLLRSTNDWLQRLDIGYSLGVRSVGLENRDLFELRLEDTRRKVPIEVSLADVGYGISQLLPFVVQSLASQEQIISIEQPEVHIHPRLQADLGDLLAEAIKPPRKNQFIIETHSEHLILRILRRIREAQGSSESNALRPEDVSVLYVMADEGGAKVEQIPILPEGDFAKPWPRGFFSERAKELF